MNSVRILGVILVVSGATAAFADCPTKDLNAGPTSPLHGMPIYDQDGTGSCYAHGASQLVTYELNQQKGNSADNEVNPIFAAWVEKYEDSLLRSNGVNGGESVEVIKSLKSRGVCSPKSVAKGIHILKYACAKDITDAQLIHLLELLYDNYSSLSFDPLQRVINKVQEVNKKTPWVSDCQIDTVAGLAHLNGLMNIPATQILSTLFSDCVRIPMASLPDPQHYGWGDDEGILKELDLSLDHDKPASIAVCAEIFDDPKTELLHRSPPLFRGSNGNLPSKCGNHEVVVTARAIVGGSCKYLIRNSWGALWKSPGGQACACILNSGEYKDVCTAADEVREYVGCWFDKDFVGKNITDLTTFYKH